MHTNIIRAIRFATKAHHGQTRKGSKTPYITHPLTVGLILSRIQAPQGVIIAGILHDTIEDCHVTHETIAREFSEGIADTVLAVSNLEPFDDYGTRTRAFIMKILNDYTYWPALVRSADILANGGDVLLDSVELGQATVFSRFKGSRHQVISRYLTAIKALRERFPENPLNEELAALADSLDDLLIVNPVDK